jgi:Integrase core domain
MIDCGPNRMSARHLGTRIMTGFLEQIRLMYERMPHVAGSSRQCPARSAHNDRATMFRPGRPGCAGLSRRNLVWINVTTNPTAEWIARQITEAFPWNEGPRYLVRDRDQIFGAVVMRRIRAMGIRDKRIAPVSPWQNGFAERLIGSIRRECVDHFVVLGEAHLRRILQTYARYYNNIRTHRSLDKDAPVSRPIQLTGIISSHPILGGLHHHYVRVKVFGTHRGPYLVDICWGRCRCSLLV